MDAQTMIAVLTEQLVETQVERNAARAAYAGLLKELGEIRVELEQLKKPKRTPAKRTARKR